MNKRAFTLIELLVASGIIAFVSVIIAQVLFSSIHLNTKTEVIKELKQTEEMTLEKIGRMIQNSESITCTTSTLTIIGQDGGTTTLESVVDESTGVTRIASNSMYLTSSTVTLIEPLVFTCVEGVEIPTSISLSFRLRQKNLAATSYEAATETFQTTISVRNVLY